MINAVYIPNTRKYPNYKLPFDQSLTNKDKTNFEIVITRFNESVTWAENYAKFVTVYNKGADDIPGDYHTIQRPNIGNDPEAILHHILCKWDNLADVTFFAQGGINDRKDQLIKYSDIKSYITTENIHFNEKRGDLPKNDEVLFDPAFDQLFTVKFGDLYEHIFHEPYNNNGRFFWVAGSWISVKRDIIKKVPIQTYQRALALFQTYRQFHNVIFCHVERLFLHMLTKTYSTCIPKGIHEFMIQKRCREGFDNRDLLRKFGKYTDKLLVKDIISNKQIPNFHIAKVLGVYGTYDAINLDELPEKFVIKANHWCGDVKIILSKEFFSKKKDEYQKFFNCLLTQTYGQPREPHYKYIPPQLFIEEYLGDQEVEYNSRCINGKTVFCARITKDQSYYYDRDWRLINMSRAQQKFKYEKHEKPPYYDEIIHISDELAKEFDYVRIDFYVVHGKIYFGEYTFTPRGCYQNFNEHHIEALLLRILKGDAPHSEIGRYLYHM